MVKGSQASDVGSEGCSELCVCVDKTNTSTAVKQVKNVSVAVINPQQKDNVVNSDAAVKSAYDLLMCVISKECYLTP